MYERLAAEIHAIAMYRKVQPRALSHPHLNTHPTIITSLPTFSLASYPCRISRRIAIAVLFPYRCASSLAACVESISHCINSCSTRGKAGRR